MTIKLYTPGHGKIYIRDDDGTYHPVGAPDDPYAPTPAERARFHERGAVSGSG